MWTYNQANGSLSQNGILVGMGYSGFAEGKNNPSLEWESNIGPIPRGDWTIDGSPFDSPTHGPYCLRLLPAAETETFGRSGFLMHGDSKIHPGMASKGCIIQLHATRTAVYDSGDRGLIVV